MTPEQEAMLVARYDEADAIRQDLASRRIAVRKEADAAADAVRLRHAPALAELGTRLAAAEAALDDARLAIGRSHALLGSRASCPPIASGAIGRPGLPARRGVIECFATGDAFTGRMTPYPGQIVIRVLRADGQPGATVVGMEDGRLPPHWTIDEDQERSAS